MNKAQGAGRQGRYKAEGVRCQGTYEAMGAGRRGKFKGGGTGRHDQDTSDTSSSMNNSRGRTSVKDTLEKRRMQVQEGDGE